VATLDGRGRPWWWHLNAAGLRQIVEVAGFDVVSGPDRLYIPAGVAQPIGRFKLRLLRSREGRKGLVHAWRGDPHAVIVARPRATPPGTAAPAAA
jgi:hypothetical protein